MTTEERLEKLERELTAAKRRLRWLMAVVGLAVAGLGLFWIGTKTTTAALAQTPSGAPKEIRANKFILEDETGNPRAWLAVEKDGPVLVLVDENGKTRARLDVIKNGPGLSLTDANGKLRAMLSVNKDEPVLSLFDANYELRAMLSVNKDEPVLCLTDANGKLRATLSVNKDGPALSLTDENGKGRACLGVNQTETPDGKIITYPESTLLLFDATGKVLQQIPGFR